VSDAVAEQCRKSLNRAWVNVFQLAIGAVYLDTLPVLFKMPVTYCDGIWERLVIPEQFAKRTPCALMRENEHAEKRNEELSVGVWSAVLVSITWPGRKLVDRIEVPQDTLGENLQQAMTDRGCHCFRLCHQPRFA
jgi:hypothetical protein